MPWNAYRSPALDLSTDTFGASSETRLLGHLPLTAGAAVVGVGVVVLIGWAIGNPALQGFFLDGVTVKANTALGLALSAGAMLLFRGDAARLPRRRPTRVRFTSSSRMWSCRG
jgi:hypothetical protein